MADLFDERFKEMIAYVSRENLRCVFGKSTPMAQKTKNKGWLWRLFAVTESGKDCSQNDADEGCPLIEPQACNHLCLRLTAPSLFCEPSYARQDKVEAYDQME